MVYVELRALRGDNWNENLDAGQPLGADKRLSHMPTPENDTLSYISFTKLTNQISRNWHAFSCYLPPQSIWEAKLEEVSQIRNRIAHFRRGHVDDYQRLLQLLRDLDAGFWMFCTSYNDPHPVLPSSDDPVTERFQELDPFPWTKIDGNRWARIGHAPHEMVLSVTIEVIRRPWAKRSVSVAGSLGYFYDVNVVARNGRTFDYPALLKSTGRVHPRLVHFCLSDPPNAVRLTIPALLGAADVISIVEDVLDVARCAVSPSGRLFGYHSVQDFAERAPEFVLGPENPLSFLSPDMECTFFSA